MAFDMGEKSTQSLLSRASISTGSVVGLLHAGVAVLLWDYFGLDNLPELVAIKPLVGGYILVGMFALGFVPTLFYVSRTFVSPAAVVGGSLLLSIVGSLLVGPVRAPAGTPTPFGFYILFWIGVVALAGLIGGFERVRK